MSINLDGLEPWSGLGGAPISEAGVVVAGLPYDGSAVYRPGAAEAPAALRRLSAVVPPVSEEGLPFDHRIHDLGDLTMPQGVEQGWPAVAAALAAVPAGAILSVIGGDHCAAIPVLAAQARRHPGLMVAWIDAHPDLCDYSRGGAWTCGCALRRGLEVAGLGPGDVVLAGCRDFDREEVEWIRAGGTLMLTASEVARDPVAAGRAIAAAVGARPLHLSVDIDVLDPAFAPGTEVGCAGGLSTRQLLALLGSLAGGCRLVGLDLCEVSPPLDVSDITVLAALKVLAEFWGIACRQPM